MDFGFHLRSMKPLCKSVVEPTMRPRVCRRYVGSMSDTWTLGLTSCWLDAECWPRHPHDRLSLFPVACKYQCVGSYQIMVTGHVHAKACRKGVVEGASEGYVGRYVGAMVQPYVGQVCRKGLSEGLSGGYVGEWLWGTREPPPRVDIRVTLKAARGHIYI